MLDTQYRMHPLICGFISRTFYGGALSDAPGMAEKTAAPWHASPCFGPLAFFDVRGATGCLALHTIFLTCWASSKRTARLARSCVYYDLWRRLD